MAAHALPTTSPRHRSVTWSSVTDAATYWTAIASLYIAYGFLWFFAAKQKLFDQNGKMPAGLAKTYQGHFLTSFPGLNTTWLLLGLLEGAAFLVIVASLVAGEFLPHRRKPILLAGLALSMLTFAAMTFGQNIVGNFDGVASLFTYMGVTSAAYALLRFVPSFRGDA
jgi:hypothetical protein